MNVNGLTDPRAQCPPNGNPADTFHLGPQFGGVYACPDADCIVEPLWGLHVGVTEIWCENAGGASPIVAVPEVGPTSGLLICLLFLILLRRRRYLRNSNCTTQGPTGHRSTSLCGCEISGVASQPDLWYNAAKWG